MIRILKSIVALIAAAAAALYLSNMGAGVVEVIPDNIPLVGNLDEFIASLILIRALAYLGIGPAGWRAPRSSKLDDRAS